jgi:hypothetical protein
MRRFDRKIRRRFLRGLGAAGAMALVAGCGSSDAPQTADNTDLTIETTMNTQTTIEQEIILTAKSS